MTFYLQCQLLGVARPRATNWSYIHQQLRHKSVTLMLLWQEYKEQYPQGYQYRQFCHLYRQWANHIDPVMRHELNPRLGQEYPRVTLIPASSGLQNLVYAEFIYAKTKKLKQKVCYFPQMHILSMHLEDYINYGH